MEFTSNHEDYMHRGAEAFLHSMPACLYNMWVYTANKLTEKDTRRDHFVDGSVTPAMRRERLRTREPEIKDALYDALVHGLIVLRRRPCECGALSQKGDGHQVSLREGYALLGCDEAVKTSTCSV